MRKEREAVVRYLRNLAAQARHTRQHAKQELTKIKAAEREKAYTLAARLTERMRG